MFKSTPFTREASYPSKIPVLYPGTFPTLGAGCELLTHQKRSNARCEVFPGGWGYCILIEVYVHHGARKGSAEKRVGIKNEAGNGGGGGGDGFNDTYTLEKTKTQYKCKAKSAKP